MYMKRYNNVYRLSFIVRKYLKFKLGHAQVVVNDSINDTLIEIEILFLIIGVNEIIFLMVRIFYQNTYNIPNILGLYVVVFGQQKYQKGFHVFAKAEKIEKSP